METIYSIGGIAAVFNATIAGFVLGWEIRGWLKRKETVAPTSGRLPDVIVVDLGGRLRGADGAPTAPEGDQPAAAPEDKSGDDGNAGHHADNNS
jgi:hypothetical protein